ncbi:hypothetical protein [Pseudoduganella sp. OTU4001]|uniref:hypothetical protein n=1 Tax=Pseudoduganella sp. OTU4001 TaxID=3043854 RepID=UPI00313D031E
MAKSSGKTSHAPSTKPMTPDRASAIQRATAKTQGQVTKNSFAARAMRAAAKKPGHS